MHHRSPALSCSQTLFPEVPSRPTGTKPSSSSTAVHRPTHTVVRATVTAPATSLASSTDNSGSHARASENDTINNNTATAATLVESRIKGSDTGTPHSRQKQVVRFNNATRTVLSQQNQQKQHSTIPEDSPVDAAAHQMRGATATTTTTTPLVSETDPWSSVFQRVAHKVAAAQPTGSHTATAANASRPAVRISLAHVLKSSGVQHLVKQAVATRRRSRSAVPASASMAATTASPLTAGPRSAVMEHWVKTAMLRTQTDAAFDPHDDDDDGDAADADTQHRTGATSDSDGSSDDDDAARGIESGFDVRAATSRYTYGRTLLLEESCRRAFAQQSADRSAVDLQALKAWFQLTKLKITTDFDRLQPSELDLLCRRMTLVSFHAHEIVFRQGDDGDALFIVFRGTATVRVSQRVGGGEHVEVTVCELTKGDYFGERALLTNDVRAATVAAKTPLELVSIARSDYTMLLKNDQLAFLSRMQMANGGSATAAVLPKSAQQSQREYARVLSKKPTSRTKADVDLLSSYLETLKFFRPLPKSFVRELCSVVDSLTLPPGAAVFREGDVGDLFYIVFTGSVDIIVRSKNQRGEDQQTKLIHLIEGSHFGELALMKGHGIRSATVVTRELCRFLVICARDYNATLRRMQKDDLAKRVSILDRIPLFQTPEWTSDLLKEMSYVLTEQTHPQGRVLYQQGDRALQLFFLVRGELVMTKDIVDVQTHATHSVVVERIGRFRVIGDDAAAGATFNEPVVRDVTVTATTPIEVLVLSKYDVFHRLSRAARDALRSAAHAHGERVVDLDRFHKTDKWRAYKQRVLHEHVNHARLAKILSPLPLPLPASNNNNNNSDTKQQRNNKPPMLADAASAANDVTHKEPVHVATSGPQRASNTSMLVSANEFLLLPPVGEHTAASNASDALTTLNHFAATFNADAPPSVARRMQLTHVLRAERRRALATLNEGNPLAYFALDATQEDDQHPKHEQHEDKARSPVASEQSTRRCTTASPRGAVLASARRQQQRQPTRASDDAIVDQIATNVLNQLGHENFVFARPARRRDFDSDSSSAPCNTDLSSAALDSERLDSNSNITNTNHKATDADRIQQLCDGDFVVVRVTLPRGANIQNDCTPDSVRNTLRSLQSPVVTILRAVHSFEQALALAQYAGAHDALAQCDLTSCSSSESVDRDAAAATAYYVLRKHQFAVLPRAHESCDPDDERLQCALVERYGQTIPTAAATGASDRLRSTASAASNAPTSALFGSFQKLLLLQSPLPALHEDIAHGHATNANTISSHSLDAALDRPRVFAVVSVILSTREIANSVCDEPFLCVHELFASEALAATAALDMRSPFRNALVCVVPVGEQLHVEDAYDWCVQVESDRRETRTASGRPSATVSPNRTRVLAPASPASVASPARRLGLRRTNAKVHGGAAGLSQQQIHPPAAAGRSPASPAASLDAGSVVPAWQVEREQAHRLHQFVCSRLGQRAIADKERREQQEATTGFTPKRLLTLEEKLASLHEYLEDSNAAIDGSASSNSTTSNNGVVVDKNKHTKRFGSIMRARIGSTIAISNNNNHVSNANSTGSPTSAPPVASSSTAIALSLAAVSAMATSSARTPR